MHRPSSRSFELTTLEERKFLSASLPNAQAASIAYDSAGVLYVAYYDSASMNLKFAKRAANGNWSAITTLDSAQGAGAQVSLALDSQNHPGVAYYDAAHRDLKYAHFDGSKWSLATIDADGKV